MEAVEPAPPTPRREELEMVQEYIYFYREAHRQWMFTGLIRDSTGSVRLIRLMQAAGVKV